MLYDPAEDSIMLQEQVRKYAKGKVLDLGTGTGIQALTALEKTKNVLASDINEEAVKNCEKLGINCIKSDLFKNIKEKFDLIIFNPPYLPDDKIKLEDNLNYIGGKKGNELSFAVHAIKASIETQAHLQILQYLFFQQLVQES